MHNIDSADTTPSRSRFFSFARSRNRYDRNHRSGTNDKLCRDSDRTKRVQRCGFPDVQRSTVRVDMHNFSGIDKPKGRRGRKYNSYGLDDRCILFGYDIQTGELHHQQ
jgi:hypothetical protein